GGGGGGGGSALGGGEGRGPAPRRTVTAQVAVLTDEDRRVLSRVGVTVGRLAVYLPALQKPDAMRLRARLYAVRNREATAGGPDGAPSAPRDRARPPGFYLPRGYLPLGPRPARL